MGLASIFSLMLAFFVHTLLTRKEKKMNKEAMQQQILEALEKKLGDEYSIRIREVYKTNIKLDGLTILKMGDNVSPTVYLEPYYEKLENGEQLNVIADEISRLYFCSKIEVLDFDISPIQDFNFVKERLFVQIINRHYNKELLSTIPHMPFLDDFAVTARCLLDLIDEGHSSFLIEDKHLKIWGMGKEELLAIAVQNTRKMIGVDVKGMATVLKENCPEFVGGIPDLPLWVMTNKRKYLGASTVLFDDILWDFANVYGNFYVIFSSVHEVLLLPTEDSSDIDLITAINQSVNDTEVKADEVLGTKAYFYSRENGFVCKG